MNISFSFALRARARARRKQSTFVRMQALDRYTVVSPYVSSYGEPNLRTTQSSAKCCLGREEAMSVDSDSRLKTLYDNPHGHRHAASRRYVSANGPSTHYVG